MRIAYIIPGFGESSKYSKYRKIADMFKIKGIKPILVDINWNKKAEYKSMSDYVKQFLKKCKHKKKDEIYLLGFSFGASIAFISSKAIKPKLTILCSLSPLFKEDLPYLRQSWKNDIKKLKFDMSKIYSFNTIAKNVKKKVIIMVGSKEYKELIRRAKNAKKKLQKSELIIVKNNKHDISKKEYLESLKKVIFKI